MEDNRDYLQHSHQNPQVRDTFQGQLSGIFSSQLKFAAVRASLVQQRDIEGMLKDSSIWRQVVDEEIKKHTTAVWREVKEEGISLTVYLDDRVMVSQLSMSRSAFLVLLRSFYPHEQIIDLKFKYECRSAASSSYQNFNEKTADKTGIDQVKLPQWQLDDIKKATRELEGYSFCDTLQRAYEATCKREFLDEYLSQ